VNVIAQSVPEVSNGSRLAGKTAIVTGGASGIGLGVAERFAQEGARVMVIDRAEERLANVMESRLSKAGTVSSIVADVTIAEQVTNAVQETIAQYGEIDVLVNNAGAEQPQGGIEIDEAEWDRQISVNLKSVYLVSRTVWPHFVERGGGAIVNAASMTSFSAFQSLAAYCTAKAGVLMLTKCMALDGAPYGIRSNCVCPGVIRTPNIEDYMARQADPAAGWAWAETSTPLGRVGEPGDVAAGYLYLASDDARFVTGTSLPIDGGLLAGVYFPAEIE
jgi:NAD(P)-dependent dehydrogenase (short-subunit alcohol dehydrogenase family)